LIYSTNQMISKILVKSLRMKAFTDML